MISNTATLNTEDGFDIDDDDNIEITMTGNTAIKNTKTGIETDGGVEVTLSDNVMKRNNPDLAGKGDDCNNPEAVDGGGNGINLMNFTGGFNVCVAPD